MAQFDVYESASKYAPFLVDVQSDILSELKTRVVIPLIPKRHNHVLSRLHPLIIIDDHEYVFRTAEMTSIKSEILKKRIVNIEDDYRSDIIAAMDFLMLGY